MKKLCIVMTVVLCLSLFGGCSTDTTVSGESGSSIADDVESAIENIINNATSTTDTQGSESTTVSAGSSTTQSSTPAKSTAGSKTLASSTSKSQTPSSSATTKVVQNGTKYITGISINKKPNKTAYVTGDKKFDPTGMVLNRHYSDGSSDTISGGFKILNFFTSTPGAKQVDIEYKHENGSVLYCKLDITVTKKQHGTPNNVGNDFHHELENEILRLTNEARAKAGLSALKMDNGNLMKAADIRAMEIVILYAHERPDHDKWSTVFDEEDTGYKYRAENVGTNNVPTSDSTEKVTDGIFNAWMNSEAHKANIMDSKYTHISIACLKYNGNYYWVQLFGAK